MANNEHAPNLDEDGCPIFEWEVGHQIIDEGESDDENQLYDINTVSTHTGPEDLINDTVYAITSDTEDDEVSYDNMDDSDEDTISNHDLTIDNDPTGKSPEGMSTDVDIAFGNLPVDHDEESTDNNSTEPSSRDVSMTDITKRI